MSILRKARVFLVALAIAVGLFSFNTTSALASTENYSFSYSGQNSCGETIDVTYWFARNTVNGERIVLSTFVTSHSSPVTWIEAKGLPTVNGQLTTDGPTHYAGSGSYNANDKDTAAIWGSGVNVTNQTSLSFLDGTVCEIAKGSL